MKPRTTISRTPTITRVSLLATALALLATAGCSDSNKSSSGRTQLTPANGGPGGGWREPGDPLWYDGPVLVTPSNSPAAQRQRDALARQKKALAAGQKQLEADRAQLEADRKKLQAEQGANPKPFAAPPALHRPPPMTPTTPTTPAGPTTRR